jgi:hypothetical protein
MVERVGGKGEGMNPSRPLLMAVFLFFLVAAHVFFLLLHVFIHAEKRISSVDQLLSIFWWCAE